jgi:hypothetical protein
LGVLRWIVNIKSFNTLLLNEHFQLQKNPSLHLKRPRVNTLPCPHNRVGNSLKKAARHRGGYFLKATSPAQNLPVLAKYALQLKFHEFYHV